jgi:hypothetical protein
MKNRPSVFRMALPAITAAAVCLGVSWSVASAQSASPNNAGSATPPTANAAQAPSWPSGVSEVMKMVKGGISADIIVSYINNSSLSFYLSADNLISLQRDGVPAPVLTAMLQRYGEMRRPSGTAAGAPAQAPSPAPAPQHAGPPAQAPYPAAAAQYYAVPQPPVISYPYVAPPSYPVYDPYYFYAPYFYPGYPFGGPVVFGFGFGGGHWGGRGHFVGGRRR